MVAHKAAAGRGEPPSSALTDRPSALTTGHVCDSETCGLIFDPACPQWRLDGLLQQAKESELRLEWERRDRVTRRVNALLRDDPELPGVLLALLARGWSDQP